MRTRKLTLKLGAAALTCTALALATSQALAAEYWLKAGTTSVTMPDGAVVVMWGYANCAATFATCGTPTVPGPALTVPPGDATLTVHLLNGLTVPTSLVINGLIKAPTNPMVPVWDTGVAGARPSLTARVRSFDAEAVPNNGAQADYIWGSATNPAKPGTYLYQSGTQPQVQVQMGLYGAATKNVANAAAATATDPAIPGQAYTGTGYAFDNEATLLYSEIDPALHAAVANDDYGPGKGTTSTIDYTGTS
jgi:FtsP/CotA-like multicopper oxidase with cupredoxin domain